MNTRQLEDAHTSGVYPKRPLTIVRGEGAILYDDAGNHYVDCAGGQGAANLGHSHPAVVPAIPAQAHLPTQIPGNFSTYKHAHLLGNTNTQPSTTRTHRRAA